MNRVFTNGPGDWGSVPGRVIPKLKKVVLDAALLNTHGTNIKESQALFTGLKYN